MKRPILRYHGGKWRLAKWIISHFPQHRIYVEPFGGAASVLLQKERCYSEVYNDLDNEIVNLFKVARDNGKELVNKLELTPFAKEEFLLSYECSDDHLEQARRTVVRSFQGFGSNALGKLTGFRANTTRSGTTPSHDWANYPECLKAIIERLQGVVIENKDALEIIKQHDTQDTLFYVDPPYHFSTRDYGRDYKHEISEDDHKKLAAQLNLVHGYVVLSGYRCDLYDELYKSWLRIDKNSHADGAKDRIESIWLNKKVAAQQKQIDLFKTG